MIRTKSFLVLFLFVLAINSQAQKATLRAGVNFANVSTNSDGEIDDANTLTTFQVGFTGDLKLLPFLFFQPGIVFTGKGSKTQAGSTSDATYFRAKSNPFYVEVPMNFVLKTPGPIRLFAGAGPYIAIGVSGKNKTNGKVLGNAFTSEKSIDWSNDDPTTLDYEEGSGFGILKRFDYGLNGLAGIEMKSIVLGLNFGLGLAKLQSGSNSSEDNNNKHRVFSAFVGIKL